MIRLATMDVTDKYGMPPAVKGLANLQFNERENAINFEFEEDSNFVDAIRDQELGRSIAAKVNGGERYCFNEPNKDQLIGESIAAKIN